MGLPIAKCYLMIQENPLTLFLFRLTKLSKNDWLEARKNRGQKGNAGILGIKETNPEFFEICGRVALTSK